MSETSSDSKSESSEEKDDDDIYKKLDADKLVDAYGKYGRYQIFAYFLCQMLNFPYAASMYVMNYVQMNPVITCLVSETNQTLKTDESCWIEDDAAPKGLNHRQCSQTGATNMTLTDTGRESVIREFGLTCGPFVWKEAGLVIFTVGALLTVPFMASLADKYGRRPVLMTAVTVAFLANVATAFAPEFWSFLALRFIVGAASDTYLSIASIATCEFVSEKFRAYITVMYTIAWSCGMFWIGTLSLLLKEWRMMYLAHAAPAVLCVAYFFILPESPHWLIHKQDTKKIKKYIETSNKWNKCEIDLRECVKESGAHSPVPQSFKHVCGSRTILKYIVINGYIQFTMSLIYFAISYKSTDLSDDKFTAFMLSALVEIPGGLMVTPLMIFFPRRWIVSISLFVQAGFLIGAAFIQSVGSAWLTGFLLAAKLVNCVTYGIHPIYASEMMPTSVRSLAFSIINVPQSLGIIAASYFKHVHLGPDWVPYSVVGGMVLIASGIVLLLPETKNRSMPPDIQSLAHTGECSDVEDGDRYSLICDSETKETKDSSTKKSSTESL